MDNQSKGNMIFGIRPVAEAIEAGREIEKIYMRKGAEGVLITDLREECRRRGLKVQEVPVEKLNYLTKGNHQGVVSIISTIEYATLEDILEGVPEGQTPFLLILDSVTDVRNFGAISRSAECAGVHGIITSLKNSAPVNSDAIRTSAGALTRIPVCRVGSIRNTIKILQQSGIKVAAATEKSSTLLFGADIAGAVAIVMGNEETGVSREVLKLCDLQLAVPIVGRMESLNVSAAAAVMMFEVVRQRIID